LGGRRRRGRDIPIRGANIWPAPEMQVQMSGEIVRSCCRHLANDDEQRRREGKFRGVRYRDDGRLPSPGIWSAGPWSTVRSTILGSPLPRAARLWYIDDSISPTKDGGREVAMEAAGSAKPCGEGPELSNSFLGDGSQSGGATAGLGVRWRPQRLCALTAAGDRWGPSDRCALVVRPSAAAWGIAHLPSLRQLAIVDAVIRRRANPAAGTTAVLASSNVPRRCRATVSALQGSTSEIP